MIGRCTAAVQSPRYVPYTRLIMQLFQCLSSDGFASGLLHSTVLPDPVTLYRRVSWSRECDSRGCSADVGVPSTAFTLSQTDTFGRGRGACACGSVFTGGDD
jgi:hypothetical protein